MLIITLTVDFKSEFQQQFIYHMRALADLIRQEDGAITFEQSLSIDEPNKLVIYEEWQSEDLFKQHLMTEHMQSHFEKVETWINSLEMKSYNASELVGLM